MAGNFDDLYMAIGRAYTDTTFSNSPFFGSGRGTPEDIGLPERIITMCAERAQLRVAIKTLRKNNVTVPGVLIEARNNITDELKTLRIRLSAQQKRNASSTR